MRFLLLVSALVCCALLPGCRQDPPTVPRSTPALSLGHPGLAFEAVLSAARANGYEVLEYDPARGYVRVLAHLDANSASVGFGYRIQRRDSFLSFQVYADGSVQATASGFHVRGNSMDESLAEEVDLLMDRIAREAARLRGFPPPQPTPPPSIPSQVAPPPIPSGSI